MRTPEQRGVYGRWLLSSRTARGYKTAEKALEALSAAGIRIGKSTYAEYEAGTKVPSRNHLPLLERFWGAPKGEDTEDVPSPALQPYLAKIDELLEEVHEDRRLIRELLALVRPTIVRSEENSARIARLEVAVRRLDPTLAEA